MSMKTGELQKAKKVLDYWYAIEFLAQDKYDDMWEVRKKMQKAQENFANGRLRSKTIWSYRELQDSHSTYDTVSADAVSLGMKKWGNITVYIGKMRREACIDCIAKLLPKTQEEERPEKSYDSIAWASLQLAPDGTYLEQSLSLSTIIWSMNQIKTGSGRLSERIDEKKYRRTVEELEAIFFSKKTRKTEPDNMETEKKEQEEEKEQIQEFDSGAVTAETLKNLYQYIEKHFVHGNIERTETGQEYQEIYGLHFQLFLDERSRNRLDEDNYLGLSHDYFSDDLKCVLKAVEDGAISSQGYMSSDLIRYISGWGEDDQNGKIDLVHPKDRYEFLRQVFEIMEVEHAPLGKWPTKYMPALMQQIAVNLFIKKGTTKLYGINGTVFSVNGPPGTGKTTLLKEIVVSNIIERAILLSKYQNPDDAFERQPFLHGDKQDRAYSTFTRGWYRLKNDKINDYSILVTSCNNAAVENVSKELPLLTGLLDDLKPTPEDTKEYTELLDEVSGLFNPEKSNTFETINKKMGKDVYFTEYAKDLLDKEEIWGLIAAPLGKKANIAAFYNHVLYPLYWDFYPGKHFKELRIKKYEQAKEDFEKQLTTVKKLQGQLKGISSLVRERTNLALELEELNQRLSKRREEYHNQENEEERHIHKLTQSLNQRADEVQRVLDKKNQLQNRIDETIQESNRQIARKRECLEQEVAARGSTGIFHKLFNKKKAAANERLADEYHQDVLNAEAEVERIGKQLFQLEELLKSAQREIDCLKDERKQIESDITNRMYQIDAKKRQISGMVSNVDRVKTKLADINVTYSNRLTEFTQEQSVDAGLVLDSEFIDNLLSSDDRKSTDAQVANPWFTKRYNIEREKLFYYAIKLNKEFVLSSKSCRDNFKTLGHYWGLLQGDEKERIMFHKEDKARIAGALYQTLFLLVPVLSSTFASLGTFLRDAKQTGVIGTLIIDEAGMAQPQMAVGALYRSRKAMIVGDPKQVEPVVTDDLKLLKKTFEDKELQPYKSKSVSVQSFADKCNCFGTYLDNGTDYPDWVGCPLLVHRRCISPMYEISNEISYNGMMKQQTRNPDEKKSALFVYEKSQWIQVEGKEKGNKNHFVEEQAQKVCEILETAFSKADSPSLYIISPFTSVVSGMKAYIREYKKKTVDTKLRSCEAEWMNKNIGTVHTFQGKEANEVIFLLGCDKSREARGAIQWVNTNIVNVAVTRAKYRLYVIGDEEAWRSSSCVKKAKTILDTYAIKKIKAILEEQLPVEEEAKALASASLSLPSISSFRMNEMEDEDGVFDYSIETDSLLQALDQSFNTTNLTKEQLEKFGFRSMEDINKFLPEIQNNLIMGMKLFYLLSPVYHVNRQMDASCCAILFCKAMELQMKDCFEESLKAIFPHEKIKGFGKGRGMVELRDAKACELTLGAFITILKRQSDELEKIMERKGKLEYGKQWWAAFEERLSTCADRRNKCCHSGLFTWKDQSNLLSDMFIRDKKNTAVQIDGVLFESKIGKKLI